MLDLGYINQSEYDEALGDNLYDRIQIVNAQNESSASTSYFVDALTDEVVNDLVDQKGYTEAQAYQMLYSGGLTINSTQDSNIQTICEEEVNNNANYSDHVLYSFSYRLTVTKKDGTYQNYSEQTMLTYYQAQNPNYDINFSSQEECDQAIEQYKSEIMEEGDTIAEGGETITYTLQPQAAISVIDPGNRTCGCFSRRSWRQDSQQDAEPCNQHYTSAGILLQDHRVVMRQHWMPAD